MPYETTYPLVPELGSHAMVNVDADARLATASARTMATATMITLGPFI